jgi:hypothetical protein
LVSDAVSRAVSAVAHRRGMTAHELPAASPTCPLLVAFHHEWQRLRSRPRLLARARGWGVTDRRFGDLEELLTHAGYRRPSSGEADEVLRRLVGAASTDELAARVVLQRILPGLASAAGRRRFYGDEQAIDEIVSAAWITIRTYRYETRRTHVAANLVGDAAYLAFIAPRRRMSATEASIDPRALDDRPATTTESPCEELARVLAEAAAGGVSASELDLLRGVVRSGSSSVAADLDVTARTVRNRRDRTAARIRELALAA